MLKNFNLALRGIMETGIVLALGFWGYHVGDSSLTKILFCILAPLLAFGFWGLVDFHSFGGAAEYLRLSQELIICALATVLLYTTGKHILGTISVLHHILVYLSGDRLIKKRTE